MKTITGRDKRFARHVRTFSYLLYSCRTRAGLHVFAAARLHHRRFHQTRSEHGVHGQQQHGDRRLVQRENETVRRRQVQHIQRHERHLPVDDQKLRVERRREILLSYRKARRQDVVHSESSRCVVCTCATRTASGRKLQ